VSRHYTQVDKNCVLNLQECNNNSRMFNEIAKTLYEKEVLNREDVELIAKKYYENK
jgi:hypothetical protein